MKVLDRILWALILDRLFQIDFSDFNLTFLFLQNSNQLLRIQMSCPLTQQALQLFKYRSMIRHFFIRILQHILSSFEQRLGFILAIFEAFGHDQVPVDWLTLL
jgi:hypothetical protein